MDSSSNITEIKASEHPLEDVAFLEETFDLKDWQARIVFADDSSTAIQQLKETKQRLEKQNYIVRVGRNSKGQSVLDVHHLGEGTSSAEILNELGPAAGIATLITHPIIPLSNVVSTFSKGGHFLDKAMHDPAHANGVINIAAESLLIPAGFLGGHKTERGFKHFKNWLMFLSYVPFLSQSALFAFMAKNSDDMAMERLDRKIKRINRSHDDLVNLTFDPTTDVEKDTKFNHFRHFLRRYPIQIGALLDQLGMVIYLGHIRSQYQWEKSVIAGTNKYANYNAERIEEAYKYTRKPGEKGIFRPGFAKDVRGAVISILAWGLMLLPRKMRTPEMNEKHKNNPFAQMWDRTRENPQALAGGMTVVSSISRLQGGLAKKNTLQSFGESLYIGGDVALGMTKNDEYGGEKNKNIDALCEKIATHINELPYLLGPAEQEKFIKNIAQFLKQKSLEELGGNPAKAGLTMAEVDERADHIARATLRRAEGGSRFDKLAYRVVDLINLFPAEERAPVRAQLANTLAQLSWMEASAQELTHAMEISPNAQPANIGTQQAPLDLHSVSKHLGNVVELVPGVDKGGSVTALYHTLLPFMRADTPLPTLPDAPAASRAHAPSQPLNQVSQVMGLDSGIGMPMDLKRLH